jgi:hypothetical protein
LFKLNADALRKSFQRETTGEWMLVKEFNDLKESERC